MNQRLERVGQVIRDEISSILQRDIHDPLIGFVTIMEVSVSPDLRFARVYYSVLGDDEQVRASTKGLTRARKFINGLLGERLELRYIPKLRFILDETAAKAQRMEQLLNEEQARLGLPASPSPAAESDPTVPTAGQSFPAEPTGDAESNLADEGDDGAWDDDESDDYDDDDFDEDDEYADCTVDDDDYEETADE
jgi:ribosome-binding factor A